MFDLFRSREKSTRYLLGGLLMLVAVSMVITLIPGFGGGSMGGSTDQVIAEIGKDVVTLREVQMGVNDTIRGRNIPNELISVYAPQIVNQIVSERALAYYAKELGYQTTDEDVAQVIQMQVPQLFEGGKFVGKDAYAQFLAANNTTIAEFEKQARLRAGQRRMQSAVLEGMVVTEKEIEAEYKSRNEKVTIEFAKLDPAQMEKEVKITPEELNAHWATSKGQYKVPEKRAFRMLIIDEAKISEGIKSDDATLRQFYSQNRDNFKTPERVRARHILVKTQDKPKDQEDALKKKAEDLLKQVKGGGNFAELAKKNSDDTVSAQKGGDLDWFTRGQMVKPFEDVAFTLKPNEISGVVKTDFGFHIIQTTEKDVARVKTFEEVKDTIQKEIVKSQVYDKMQTTADQAKIALQKSPASIEQVAQQLGLPVVKVEKAARGDALPVLGADQDVDDALYELKEKNTATGIVQTKSNKLVLVVLDDIQPARQAELAEVEPQIRKTLTSERAQRMLADRSKTLLDKVKAAGGDLRKSAASMNVEVKTSAEFGRDGNVEGLGTANYLEEAFRRDVGQVFGPVNVNGITFVCKITGKTPPDMGRLNAQRFDLLLRLKGKKAQERRDLFEDGLIQYLKQKGVVKIHQDTMKRLIESFKNS